MESLLPQDTIVTENTAPTGKTSIVPTQGSSGDASPIDPSKPPVIHHTKNLYPVVRHTVLVICVVFLIALIVLLVHQNGKSIYDNGI